MWINQALTVHNKLRAKHGSPPLQWSDGCYEFALHAAESIATCRAGRAQSGRPKKPGTAVLQGWGSVLSITGIDVVLPIVPSFAHHVVGTHSRQGNTGRPRSEAAKLESN